MIPAAWVGRRIEILLERTTGVNVVLDGDREADVIVRGIDNITRNRSLGVIWEKRRGKGRVVYCSLDLEAARDLPEARALRRSLLAYLGGKLDEQNRKW